MFCHNPILQHRPTLEHWETMVSTTAKVTIGGSLPVRKQLFILTIQLYKMVLPLWKQLHFISFWSVQGSRSRIPAVIPGFQPCPTRISDPISHNSYDIRSSRSVVSTAADSTTVHTVDTHSSANVDMLLCCTEAEWGGTTLTDLQLCHKQIT